MNNLTNISMAKYLCSIIVTIVLSASTAVGNKPQYANSIRIQVQDKYGKSISNLKLNVEFVKTIHSKQWNPEERKKYVYTVTDSTGNANIEIPNDESGFTSVKIVPNRNYFVISPTGNNLRLLYGSKQQRDPQIVILENNTDKCETIESELIKSKFIEVVTSNAVYIQSKNGQLKRLNEQIGDIISKCYKTNPRIIRELSYVSEYIDPDYKYNTIYSKIRDIQLQIRAQYDKDSLDDKLVDQLYELAIKHQDIFNCSYEEQSLQFNNKHLNYLEYILKKHNERQTIILHHLSLNDNYHQLNNYIKVVTSDNVSYQTRYQYLIKSEVFKSINTEIVLLSIYYAMYDFIKFTSKYFEKTDSDNGSLYESRCDYLIGFLNQIKTKMSDDNDKLSNLRIKIVDAYLKSIQIVKVLSRSRNQYNDLDKDISLDFLSTEINDWQQLEENSKYTLMHLVLLPINKYLISIFCHSEYQKTHNEILLTRAKELVKMSLDSFSNLHSYLNEDSEYKNRSGIIHILELTQGVITDASLDDELIDNPTQIIDSLLQRGSKKIQNLKISSSKYPLSVLLNAKLCLTMSNFGTNDQKLKYANCAVENYYKISQLNKSRYEAEGIVLNNHLINYRSALNAQRISLDNEQLVAKSSGTSYINKKYITAIEKNRIDSINLAWLILKHTDKNDENAYKFAVNALLRQLQDDIVDSKKNGKGYLFSLNKYLELAIKNQQILQPYIYEFLCGEYERTFIDPSEINSNIKYRQEILRAKLPIILSIFQSGRAKMKEDKNEQYIDISSFLANIYYLIGSYEKSKSILIELRMIDPNSKSIYLNLLNILHEKQYNYEAAYRLNLDWVNSNRNDSEAKIGLLIRLFETNKLNEFDELVYNIHQDITTHQTNDNNISLWERLHSNGSSYNRSKVVVLLLLCLRASVHDVDNLGEFFVTTCNDILSNIEHIDYWEFNGLVNYLQKKYIQSDKAKPYIDAFRSVTTRNIPFYSYDNHITKYSNSNSSMSLVGPKKLF